MRAVYREALIQRLQAPRRVANALPMPDHKAVGWVSRVYNPVPVLARVVWAEHPTEPTGGNPDAPDAGSWVPTLAWGWTNDGGAVLVAVPDIWSTSRSHMTYLRPTDVRRRPPEDDEATEQHAGGPAPPAEKPGPTT